MLRSLTVKLTATILPALRQAAQEEAGGSENGGRKGSVLAVCPPHRIYDEQHVDKVSQTSGVHSYHQQQEEHHLAQPGFGGFAFL